MKILFVKTFLLVVLLGAFARGEVVDREIRIAQAHEFLDRCRFVAVVKPQAKGFKGLTSIKGGKPGNFVQAFSSALIERFPKAKVVDNEIGGYVVYQLDDDVEGTMRTSIMSVDGSVRGQSFNLDILIEAGRAKRKKLK